MSDDQGKKHGSLIELVVIVGAAVLLAFLIQLFLVKPYRIPSESMVPTLAVGQRVLVNRTAYDFGGTPKRNDIVVFHPPTGANDNECGVTSAEGAACSRPTPERMTGQGDTFIKRVIGVPGDRLSIEDGFARINGKLQGQSFIKPCQQGDPQCDYPTPITIPPDHYFMMGDNRGASDDSRFWGPVPKDWLIGEAFFTYWPPNRFGLL